MDSNEINQNNEEPKLQNKQCDWKNIKSIFIIKKIFSDLDEKKLLEIVKCNKKIQKKLNIDLDDYKDYNETKTSIEIEITPVKDKYSRFIKTIKEEEKEYYHIYFDNDKKEINRGCLNKNEKVSKIIVIINHQIKSLSNLFNDCKIIESVNFKKFFRNNINDMSYMFYYCSSLKEINLSKFNTKNVANMRSMFHGCSSLKKINLSKFNTDNVTNMVVMFSGCSSLTEINLSNFKTNNLKNIRYMFHNCKALNEVDLSNFNSNNLIEIKGLFYECSTLAKINLSNFNTNQVTDMSYLFYRCSSLKEINISNFNTDKVNSMYYMFSGCPENLKTEIKTKYKNIKDEAFY